MGKAFLFLQYWSRCLLGIITPMQFFLACLCILFLLVAVYADWPSFVSWFSDKGCLPCLMWSSQGLEDFHSIVSQTVVIETRLSQDAYTERIPLLWKPVCYLPPLRESPCKLVYLRIPAFKKNKILFFFFSLVFLKIDSITEPIGFVDFNWKWKVLIAQSCLILCNHMNYI